MSYIYHVINIFLIIWWTMIKFLIRIKILLKYVDTSFYAIQCSWKVRWILWHYFWINPCICTNQPMYYKWQVTLLYLQHLLPPLILNRFSLHYLLFQGFGWHRETGPEVAQQFQQGAIIGLYLLLDIRGNNLCQRKWINF